MASKSHEPTGAFAAGMLLGAALGVIIWLTTDLFVFFPVFIAVGTTLGIAWSQSKPVEDEEDELDTLTSRLN